MREREKRRRGKKVDLLLLLSFFPHPLSATTLEEMTQPIDIARGHHFLFRYSVIHSLSLLFHLQGVLGVPVLHREPEHRRGRELNPVASQVVLHHNDLEEVFQVKMS